MFNKKAQKNIFNTVIEDMKRYNIKPHDCSLYLDTRIDYEFNKLKKKEENYAKIVVHDNHIDTVNVKNFDIVLEDFVGKDERLNTYNSILDPKFDKYYTNKLEKQTANFLFKKNKFSLIFDLKNFKNNFILFSIKHFFLSILSIINSILLILLKSLSLLIFGLFDLIVLGLFKLLKCCIKTKYSIKKYTKWLYFLLLPLTNFSIIILKFIINLINNFCYLFNNIFNNNIENIINLANNSINNITYSNNFTNAKVNRDYRSNEHKNLIDNIKNKSLSTLQEYLQNSQSYLQNFKFSTLSTTLAKPELINNEKIKERLKEVEIQQKKELKKSIITHQFKLNSQVAYKKARIIINLERKKDAVILKYINNNKKLFKGLDKYLTTNRKVYDIQK